MGYQRITAAVDLDGSISPVLRRARDLKRSQDAHLEIVTAAPDLRGWYHGAETALHDRFDRGVVEQAVHKIGVACDQIGLKPDAVEVLRGDLEDLIAGELNRSRADLVVFANCHKHGLDNLTGGFGMSLLHRAPCDLYGVCVNPTKTLAQKPLIAVNIDGFEANAVARARWLTPQGELTLLHVIARLWGDYDLDAILPGIGNNANREAETKVGAALAPILQAYPPATLHVTAGSPAHTILDFATEHDHDLLVINSGIHHGIGWRLGSTAFSVLAEAPVDVLVVRPDG